MKTRNAETPKSGPTKKTPVKKTPVKTPPKPSEASTESVTPKASSTTGPKQLKSGAAAKTATPKTASKLEPKVEDASASVDTAQSTPEEKVVPAAKSAVKKTPGKTKPPSAAKTASTKTLKSVEAVKLEIEQSPKKAEFELVTKEGKEEANEELEAVYVTKEPGRILVNLEEDSKEDAEGGDAQLAEDEHIVDEGMEDYGEQEGFEEPGDEECGEEDVSEPDEEAGGLEEEHMEISALAKERKIKKEQEIFVGGLDRDAVEEDVKKAFEKIGEVVEVRLHRNPLTNKNKGYAFVKFADKEQACRALSELKNPVIRGKRCGIAPSEDNDTLFLGNICNTWTKEAIKQKLKEYGVEGVENITLVPDAQHEGLSRGFAFLEFSCHADAMLAYKRLQKPDVIFGHAERTTKVAFAEPLREPDPEIMAQVKSVFVDWLPPHWDEEGVREHFKGYGDIERIVLARNMPTAKRKDFGFVDFTTHEAAVACIDGVNNTELGDGKSKTKVKARLANPLPKTQAVKGGMRGGFRIGRTGSGTFSRFGRGFGRGGRPFNRGNFQRGKGFYARGRGRTGRFAFSGDNDFERPYSEFRGRRPFGGRGGRRGSVEDFASRAATSSRPDLGRPKHSAHERGRGKPIYSRRQPFSPEGEFSRPFGGRHFEDPYMYDDSGRGMKRPYSMMEHDPGYLESSRLRPRFDHPDAVVSSRGTRYQDSYGAGSGLYSHDYYGSDYGGSAYSSMYGVDRTFGGGYYY